MTDSDYAGEQVDPIFRELTRIFGDGLPSAASDGFVILPLVNDADALAFLRTVPAGTSMRDLPGLAAAYRATHPTPRVDADDEDPEAAV